MLSTVADPCIDIDCRKAPASGPAAALCARWSALRLSPSLPIFLDYEHAQLLSKASEPLHAECIQLIVVQACSLPCNGGAHGTVIKSSAQGLQDSSTQYLVGPRQVPTTSCKRRRTRSAMSAGQVGFRY